MKLKELLEVITWDEKLYVLPLAVNFGPVRNTFKKELLEADEILDFEVTNIMRTEEDITIFI